MYLHQYFKVDVYSHFFKLSLCSPRGREVVTQFAKNYIQMGLVRVGRKYVRAPLKVFGARVRDGSEFRFHINQYDAFVAHLNNISILPEFYQVTIHEPPKGEPVDISVLPGWTLRDYQEPIAEYLLSPLPNTRKLVEIQPGKGKLQRLNARIKVPGGWSTMGQMYVGKKITSVNGGTQTVTGVYPHGMKQQYAVTFADGRSTEAGAEHLWKIYYHNTTKARQWRVVDTLELKRLLSLSNPRIFVPLIQSEQGPDLDLPIDPYLLGVILGDGGISQGNVNVTKGDQQLFDNIEPLLPAGMKMVRVDHKTQRLVSVSGIRGANVLKNALGDFGLMGKTSNLKWIPEVYLHGSHQQRLALVQGLLDTDGTVQKSGSVSYNSTSFRMATQVQYLIRSLGGMANLVNRQTYYTHNGEKKAGLPSYDVDIRYPRPSELFRLDAKRNRTNDNNQYAATMKLRVVSVEPTEMAESQCISVSDEEKLYVTDDFIVTHNTFLAANRAAATKARVVVILKPQYMEKWASDFEKICGIPKKETLLINGSAALMNLIATAKSGQLKARVVIISNRTLQNWFTLYERKGDYSLTQGYDCYPEELLPILGAGVRIIDEVHQDYHLNFKMDLYCHCPLTISLSATLINDDPFLSRMYEVGYPKDHRYAGLAYDRYIESTALFYSVKRPDLLKTSEWGSSTYSHHAFEQSIIKYPLLLQGYMNLIDVAIHDHYLKDYKQGNRLLVYCASIDLCTLVAQYLKKTYAGKDVRRYVEDDPYENLLDAEITVSTLQSAGTGHDIDQLSTVILTTAVSSSASNIQGFGRLRNLPVTNPEKYADMKLRFVYFVCTDVSKHVDYHLKKKELLLTRALVCGSSTYAIPLG